jgi:hypothetical protein
MISAYKFVNFGLLIYYNYPLNLIGTSTIIIIASHLSILVLFEGKVRTAEANSSVMNKPNIILLLIVSSLI